MAYEITDDHSGNFIIFRFLYFVLVNGKSEREYNYINIESHRYNAGASQDCQRRRPLSLSEHIRSHFSSWRKGIPLVIITHAILPAFIFSGFSSLISSAITGCTSTFDFEEI
jgi:hypothetical protein